MSSDRKPYHVDEPFDDVAAIYGAAGFATEEPKVVGRQPAIIVVDVQRGFLDPTSAIGGDFGRLEANLCELIDCGRNNGWPIAYSRMSYAGGFQMGGPFLRKVPSLEVFLEGREEHRLATYLRPGENEVVVDKQQPSAFFGTGLTAWLIAGHIDSVIVAGLTTSGCVRATVVDAMSYGFEVVIPMEVVIDRHPLPHSASLFDMKHKYATVCSLADVENLFVYPRMSGAK